MPASKGSVRRVLQLIVPLWVVCLIVGSLMSLEAKRAIGTESQELIRASAGTAGLALHRVYHIGSFGATALLLLFVARSAWQELTYALIVLALGVLLETIQHLVYGNVFEWWDLRDDGYGILAAYFLIRLIRLIRSLSSYQARSSV